MTLVEFADVFGMLATQLRATDVDEVTIRAYFEALKGSELEFVKAAALEFATRTDQQGQSWFPRTGEWRRAAATIEARARDEQRKFLRALPAPLCDACGDTGWSVGEDQRARRCTCADQRRAELLGRVPQPAIPPVPADVVDRRPFLLPVKAMGAAL